MPGARPPQRLGEQEREPASGLDLRLAPSALAAWAGTWWATGAEFGSVLVVAALSAAAAALVLLGVRRAKGVRQVRAAALALALTAVVLAVVGTRLAVREASPVRDWAADRAVAVLEGRVATDPRRIDPGPGGAERWLVRLAEPAVEARGSSARAAGPVVVIGGERWADAVVGTQVRVTGRLLLPQEAADVAVAGFVAHGPPDVTASGPRAWQVAEHLREGLRRACEGLPADAGGLLPALVVGDTSRLTAEVETDLMTAGMTHLTAVSGGNVAIVAAAAALALGGLGAGRRARVAGTALAVASFVVLARPEPSVLRAAVMGIVGLAGILLARPGAGLPALSGAAVALLAFDPWLARSFGFVLSVLATAGLLLLVPAWLARSRRPRALVLLVAVPLAAQAVTAPVVILLQPTVSLVAVPANALAAPAVAPATIAGVVAAALSTVWPAGAHLAALAGGLATSWLVIVADRAAAVPGGTLPWPAGLGGAALLAGLTAAAVTLSVLPSTARAHLLPPPLRRAPGPAPRSAPGPGTTPAQGRALGIAAIVAAVLAGWSAGPRLPLAAGGGEQSWTLVMCDVGQGDATLLRSGPGRAVLVDAGPDPGAVDGCLERWGVRTLDLVVLTHFHADHVAGLSAAIEGRGRPPVLVSPCSEPGGQGRDVRAAASRAGAPVAIGAAGMSGRAGDVAWRLLWPDLGAACATDADGDEINDDSLVLVAEVGGVRAVLLGDVETEAQRALTGRVPADGVDVVKVAHHGSAKQHPELYATMHARVALIGVGRANDYGHPAPSALDLLQRNDMRVLRTDIDGDVLVLGPSARLAVATHPP